VEQSKVERAHWRLHRMLLRRIAVAGVLIAAILASVTYYAGLRDMHHAAVTLAANRAAQFVAVASDVLATRPGEVQARLDQFVKGRLPPREGRIVAATIYDAAGRPVARVAQPDSAQHAEVLAFLSAQQPQAGVAREASGEAVSVSGVRHYFVQAPLRAADGQLLGQVLALFEPSETYLAGLQRRLWFTVVATIAIVFITAALLYPVILRLMRKVTSLSASLLDANLEILSVLGSAIAKRDADTDAHNYRVTVYSVRLGEAIGLDTRTMQTLIKGAFLHDVGKIGIPDHILHKPSKLDQDEYTKMKLHVSYGLDIVRRASWLADAEAVVGGHHEKFDGGGYDGKLKTEAIPIVARIFAIADVFDALTSRRPYKEALSFEATMEILEKDRGTHFDPELLDRFAAIARPLHQALAGDEGDYPQQEVQRILTRYFREDVETLLASDLTA
jgi:HD-GYP domain-containing protein (c-di-GMP phosphodiesterase class II)